MNIKKFLLILMIAGFSTSLYAQGGLRIGMKVHPLFAFLKSNTDSYNAVGSKLGLSYGLLFDAYFADNYAFSSEFSITSTGGKVEYTYMDTTIESSLKLRYIEVPLTIKLRTNEIAGMRFFGKFGLGIGASIKSSAKVTYLKSDVKYDEDEIKSASKYVNFLNLGLIIGGGIEYPIDESLSLLGGITYNGGFMNIMTNTSLIRKNTRIPSFDANASYVALNLGILF